MRVRFQFVGESVQAECDLTDKKAKEKFEELKTAGLCEWAELIGEDDNNYMDVLDSFDHIRMARQIKRIMEMFN